MGYCERCERECDALTCPVCGGALLQEVDPEAMPPEEGGWSFSIHHPDEVPWPLGPDGEPEEAVRLSNLADFPSVQTVVQARFQAAGIPVLTRYPEGGGLGKVYLGFSGYGVDLYVPKSRESEARALLLHDE